MKYSFVIIAYNEENNIEACISSILKQGVLGVDYEIIVVDDGSHDTTPEIVKGLISSNPRIKLISDGKNHGRGYGRDAGVRAACGEYIAMVDADIILPKDWLSICLDCIKDYDVVGGIAVPDGDVAYIYRRLQLTPKTTMGSTTITGNNGLYRRGVFGRVNFDKNLRNGEDVDFNHQSLVAGFTSNSIDGLTVEHQEHKSLLHSLAWLYESGIGASRQLRQFKQLRIPDIAYFCFLICLVMGVIGSFWVIKSPYVWALPLAYILLTSTMHMRTKFYYQPLKTVAYVLGILINALHIFMYYLGRTAGIRGQSV